ncbi:hypothetical protein [Arthrobacter castelli]|uniref:PGAP1-like alpha/beta domain-containing protein n=1 Tax=Arthrobacter castelli TaxID=271431 RepID=UPI000408D9B2|nr:hypothetical protein [Arthrobacter castelli]
MNDGIEAAFPNHSWESAAQPGGYTVTGGKGGISFSWQELLRGAQELESLAFEIGRLYVDLEDATADHQRMRGFYSLPFYESRSYLALSHVCQAVLRQKSEFAATAEKVQQAFDRYAAAESTALRNFELSRRRGYDAEGNRTLLPQVTEADAWWHLGDGLAMGGQVLGITKFGVLEIGPISPSLLPAKDGDRIVEDFDGSLSGLIQRTGELDAVNGKDVDGAIEISAISVDGQPDRYVVTIPGTQSWISRKSGNPIDMAGNLAGLWGAPHMSAAVTDALKEAGATSGSAVMLVGHSGGGIHARNIASSPAFQADFDPKYVVTAGSPVGNNPLPDHTVGLNLQQRLDPVPATDLRAAPDTPNNVTVEFQTDPLTEPSSNETLKTHAVFNYANKAQQLETSDHASVAPVIAGIAAFAPKGASVSSYKFKLQRTGQDAERKQRMDGKPDYTWAKGR